MNDDRAPAKAPEDLARLFNARANAGDVEGLVALYEPGATLAVGEVKARGHDEIRRFYEDLLAKKSSFPEVRTMEPVASGDVALTVALLPKGRISAEIARRQADGCWLWAVDQLKIDPA
ncbi:MAG: nuclear transport factor 2 family protein [Hansschlegelia sp.]